MVVLGIDPGTRRMGFSVLEKRSRQISVVAAGTLRTKNQKAQDRLLEIKNHLEKLIRAYKPDTLAVEKLFFSKNKKTGLAVAEARGVVLLAAAEHRLLVREYSPNEVKAGVTGYGHADKKAVAKLIGAALGKPNLPVSDDTTDALAIGFFCIHDRFDK